MRNKSKSDNLVHPSRHLREELVPQPSEPHSENHPPVDAKGPISRGTKVRVAGYEIMRGGVGRADPIAEVLLAQRADVALITGATDADVFERLRTRLGMQGIRSMIPGREGEPETGVAVLTAGRVVESIALFHLNGVGSMVVGVQVRGMELLVSVGTEIHSDAKFAAISPPGSTTVSDLRVNGFRQVRGARRSHADDRPAHPEPERGLSMLYVADDLTMHEAWTEADRLAMYASDHLPVGAEVLL